MHPRKNAQLFGRGHTLPPAPPLEHQSVGEVSVATLSEMPLEKPHEKVISFCHAKMLVMGSMTTTGQLGRRAILAGKTRSRETGKCGEV